MEPKPADALDRSQKLLGGLAMLTAAVLAALLLGGAGRRPAADAGAARLMHGLDLSALCLAPAGSPWRDPVLSHPAVDLRHTPFLPLTGPDPIRLFLPPAGQENGQKAG